MKKRLLARIPILLLWLLCIHSALIAQTKVVTGKVTDSKDGSPLQGVTVLPKGGTSGVATGKDGSFKIVVGENTGTLVFSFVGFANREIPVGSGSVQVALTAIGSSLNGG